MSRDRYERRHRRTHRHPESVRFMASANFDAVPRLEDAMTDNPVAAEPAEDLIARLSKLADHAALDQPYRCAKVSFELLLELRAALVAVRTRPHRWQPIATAPKREDVFFWVVPKTAEEAYVDTSGNPIFSSHEPRLHRGTFGTWCSLEKATHWMPLPDPPGGVASPDPAAPPQP